MLKRFHRTRACQRRADKAQSHGVEFPRRELGCGISRPKTVTVPGYDREAGDLRFAHKVVDFLALGLGRSVVVTARLRIGVRRPRVPGHSGGKVLQIRAVVESSE